MRFDGFPGQNINIVRNLYLNSSCCIRTVGGVTDSFNLGAWQGCILSPFLFLMVMNFTMKRAMHQPIFCILWKDQFCLTDLDFTDDIKALAETRECLQEMTTSMYAEASKIGLRISE